MKLRIYLKNLESKFSSKEIADSLCDGAFLQKFDSTQEEVEELYDYYSKLAIKYTLEIHHRSVATINFGHPEHDLRATVKASTLWSLLREAKKRNFDFEFYQAYARCKNYL